MQTKARTKVIGENLWVHQNGRTYCVSLKKKRRGAGADSDTGDLVAPFSCKVLEIHVEAGQQLKSGDAIVTVEAMKMEYTYNAPADGVVQKILVKADQTVDQGALFVDWKAND